MSKVARLPTHLEELAASLPVTLTMREVANVLHVSVRTVQRLIARGRIRVIKGPERNAHVIVTRSEVLRLLTEHTL